MTFIYTPDVKADINRTYARRTALLVLFCAVILGVYVYSLLGPQLKWLSLTVAVIGTALCCLFWIFCVSPVSDRRRLIRFSESGLTGSSELTFLRRDEDAEYERILCRSYVFCGTDERGESYERTLYCEQDIDLTAGKQYSLLSWCSLLLGYSTIQNG